MDPDPAAVLESLTICGIKAAETLRKFILKVAALEHARKEARQQDKEGEREKEIVDEERPARVRRQQYAHARGTKNATAVAP